MNRYHEVGSATVVEGVLYLIVDGKRITADLRTLSPLLGSATNEELCDFEISTSGYGLHWPRIDEDLSLDGLLGVQHEPQTFKKSA